jgi:hypothetical protein
MYILQPLSPLHLECVVISLEVPSVLIELLTISNHIAEGKKKKKRVENKVADCTIHNRKSNSREDSNQCNTNLSR